jgi:DNA recombination-dependent growth factor C
MSASQQSELTDLEVALFVQREKHRLSERERELIDDVVTFLLPRQLTIRQRQYLHNLFSKLGVA